MTQALDRINLNGRVAVVTGGGRGLGRAIALALAQHGAAVALVARSAGQLEDAAAQIRAGGGTACAIAADLSQPEGVAALVRQTQAELGPAAILINCAGVFGPVRLIQDTDPGEWLETLAVNTAAPFLASRAFMGGMLEAGWGRIVNVSSAAALHPPGGYNSAYAVSKAALNHLTRCLAVELAGTGVTANAIHPGDVKTEMWADIRRKADALEGGGAEGYRSWVRWVDETGGDPPEKAADLVVRLIGPEAAAINGQFLWIENGLQAPIPSWDAPGATQPWLD